MFASVVLTHSLVEPPESYTWNFLAGNFQRVKLLFAFFKTLPEGVHQQNQQVHQERVQRAGNQGQETRAGFVSSVPLGELCGGNRKASDPCVNYSQFTQLESVSLRRGLRGSPALK